MRPDVPVLALCPDCRIARQLAFFYGIVSVCVEHSIDLKAWLKQVETFCLQNEWAKKGDSVLLLPPEELLSPQNRWVIAMHTFAG
jgi:pyruvate kinase